MALLGNNLDYTDKDFDALRARLINLIRGAFPEWTDFNVANFGNILMELFSFTGDVLGFYLDNHGRESRITAAQLRKSLLGLVKLIGFVPSGAVASRVDLSFQLSAPPAGSVTIEEGDTFRTLEITDPVVFQVLEDVVIPAGANPASAVITVENSAPAESTFQSTGTPNQEFVLPATPFLDGSLELTAGNGTYTVVANFLNSTATDRHVVLVVDQNDRARIRFGNGVNGAIPLGTITAGHKTGGGADGTVNADTVKKADKRYKDSLGNDVVVTITNPLASTPGKNRQTIDEIKALAPESLRVLNRTVAREDYEINARKLADVARALMLTSNEDSGEPENEGTLYIIATGGAQPTQDLKDDVLEQVTVTFPNTLTFKVKVVGGVFLSVNVLTTVYLREGQTAAVVRARIETALIEFFQVSLANGTPNPNVDFGFNQKDANGDPAGEIVWSDVFNAIRDVEGVRKLDDTDGLLLNGARQDLAIALREFPQLGTVTITNGDTGSDL